jgi:hypothetical protein
VLLFLTFHPPRSCSPAIGARRVRLIFPVLLTGFAARLLIVCAQNIVNPFETIQAVAKLSDSLIIGQ